MKTSLIAILAAMTPLPAFAQDASSAAEPAVDDSTLSEIVVTATLRERGLQDVPISVAVVDGRTISEYGLRDLAQARQFIPNLDYQQGTEGAAVTLRGFGNNGGTNFGFDSPVGTFVDGVYHGRLNQTRLAFLDVARVEVLRGPQSTLFGMNTVAGAISVISRQPTNTLEGYVQAQYDPEYHDFEVTAAISGPLTDTLSARLAFISTNQEGYLFNTFLDRDHGAIDDDAGRLWLRWQPSSQLTVLTKLELSRRVQDGINNEVLTPPTNPDDIARMRALDPDITFTPDDDLVSYGPTSRRIKSAEALLRADYAFEPFTLTSITSYSDFSGRTALDLASAPINIGQIRGIEDFHQFSQELRIASTAPGPIEYLAGVYFQRSRLQHFRVVDFRLANFIPAFAGTPSGELQSQAGDFEQTYKTYAIFGQATWNITDALRLTAGARYSMERKRASSFFDWLVPGTTGAENALTPGTPEFDAADFVFNGLFRIVRHTDAGRYSRNAFLPEVKLQWDVTDNVVLYASYGEGEKAGGFNDRDNRAINFSFDSERSTNYEVGAKLRLLGGRAQLDIALFRTRFNDMQVSVFDLPNLVFIVDNAAQATTQGIEIESRWRISRAFTLNAALGWLERARFDEFFVQCVAGPADPDCISTPEGDFRDDGGNDLNAPKLTASVGLEFNQELRPGLRFTARADANYRSRSEDLVNAVGPILPVTMFHARLGLAHDNGWNLALMVNNITNERHIVSRSTSLFPGMFTGEVTPPRRIYLQAGFSF